MVTDQGKQRKQKTINQSKFEREEALRKTTDINQNQNALLTINRPRHNGSNQPNTTMT